MLSNTGDGGVTRGAQQKDDKSRSYTRNKTVNAIQVIIERITRGSSARAIRIEVSSLA